MTQVQLQIKQLKWEFVGVGVVWEMGPCVLLLSLDALTEIIWILF